MGFILYIISLFLHIIFVPSGIVFGLIKAFYNARLVDGLKHADAKFRKMAIGTDVYGNVFAEELFNYTLLSANSEHKFGEYGITISAVLGHNQYHNTLSRTGKSSRFYPRQNRKGSLSQSLFTNPFNPYLYMKYILILFILLEILLVNLFSASGQTVIRVASKLPTANTLVLNTPPSLPVATTAPQTDCEATVASYKEKLQKAQLKAAKANKNDNLFKLLTAVISIAATVFLAKK